MNLRVDTEVLRGGGRQLQLLTDRLASTMSSAETTLGTAADNVDQPAIKTALEDLLATLTTTHPRVTTGLDGFAQEVQIAGEVFEQRDAELADGVPEAP